MDPHYSYCYVLTEGFIGTSGVSGVTYTRWGNSSCPSSTGAQLVYARRAGGTFYQRTGGGAEKLCLPNDPDYLPGTTGVSVTTNIYGAEYEFSGGPIRNSLNHNVPCAVCYVPTRVTAIMVPTKSLCPPSWTREYYSYLTTEHFTHHRSSFNCIDVNPEIIPGTSANTDGALFYYVESTCTGLACPPYQSGRVLSCAVCTK